MCPKTSFQRIGKLILEFLKSIAVCAFYDLKYDNAVSGTHPKSVNGINALGSGQERVPDIHYPRARKCRRDALGKVLTGYGLLG